MVIAACIAYDNRHMVAHAELARRQVLNWLPLARDLAGTGLDRHWIPRGTGRYQGRRRPAAWRHGSTFSLPWR